MFYSEDIVEEVRASSDIIDVISSYIKLERKGNSFFGLCPFHNEKTPSFSVSKTKQMFYCFGCGVGGNVYTFVMSYENFTFAEALKHLAERGNIQLPEQDYSKEAKERADLRATIFEMNKAAARYFHEQLKEIGGQRTREYLRTRAISEKMIIAFGLGYSTQYNDDLYKYLKGLGYEEEIIRQGGLIQSSEKQGNYDRFWNRLMFPILDPNSKVIGFGGRVLGDGTPKYLNSPETPVFDKSRNLYGINRARISRKPFFLICEGYLDVIALHQWGYTNSVATLGTALTHGHANLIKRYVDEVYLTYDNDEAGTKAALRGIPILREAGIVVRVIILAPYKDPDDFINNLGAEEFEKRIQEAQNGFMFGLKVSEKDYHMNTPEGKTRFFNDVAKQLLAFEEELERNNYIETVAYTYQISSDSLKKLVTSTAIKEGMAKPAPRLRSLQGKEKDPKLEGLLTAQRVLLTWIIEDMDSFEIIKKHISPEDFTNDLYQTVAKLLYQQYEKGQVNPSGILNHFTDEATHKEVASLFYSKLSQVKSEREKEQALKDIIIKVKSGNIDFRSRDSDSADITKLQSIITEKRKLEDLKKRELL